MQTELCHIVKLDFRGDYANFCAVCAVQDARWHSLSAPVDECVIFRPAEALSQVRGEVAFRIKANILYIVVGELCDDRQLIAAEELPCKAACGVHDANFAVFRYSFSEVFTNGSPDGAFRLRRTDAGGELAEDALLAQCLLESLITVRRQDERVMQGISALHDLMRGLAAPHGFVPERPFVLRCADCVNVICCHKIPP